MALRSGLSAKLFTPEKIVENYMNNIRQQLVDSIANIGCMEFSGQKYYGDLVGNRNVEFIGEKLKIKLRLTRTNEKYYRVCYLGLGHKMYIQIYT